MMRRAVSVLPCMPATAIAAALLAPAGLTAAPPIEIPVELRSHMLFVRGAIDGGPPILFNIDTGAPTLVVDPEAAERLGLRMGRTTRTRGLSPTTSMQRTALPPATVTLGGASVSVRSPIATDLAGPAALFGTRFEAIIGHQLFQRYVVEVDYERSLLTLHEPDGYEYAGEGVVVPIRVTPTRGILTVRVNPAEGEPVNARVVIDTGSMDSVTLTRPLSANKTLAGKEERRISGQGFGLGGRYDGVFGVYTPSVELGGGVGVLGGRGDLAGVKIDDVMLGMLPFTLDGQGLLGAGVLHRFKVVFDYPRSRLILEPNARHGNPRLENRTGVALMASGQNFERVTVAAIYGPSPATRAGVLEGDRVLAVDGASAAELGLEGVRGALSVVGLRRLTVERGGRTLELEVEAVNWGEYFSLARSPD